MTLLELSAEYRTQAAALKQRIGELEARLEVCREKQQRLELERRLKILNGMYRDARELAALTEHYYDRGYYRNEKYTL